MVKVAQGGNDAPAERDIEVVDVLACHGLRPEIDRHGGEDALFKVALEVGIVRADGVERGAVELVEAGREELERSWAKASGNAAIAEQGEGTISKSGDPLHRRMAKERFRKGAGPLAAVRYIAGPL